MNMRRGLLLTVIVLYSAFVFAQKGKASKYLVYKETTKLGQSSLVHILAGKDLAVVCYDLPIPSGLPFLNCDMVRRNPAVYRNLHVVDSNGDFMVADVTKAKLREISRESIIEQYTIDSTFMAMFSDVAELSNGYIDEPVIMKYTPKLFTDRIGDYKCTVCDMRITETYSCRIWYTKSLYCNWVFNDVFWLVPGTVVRAEYSDGLVFTLEGIYDSDIVVEENSESVNKALRMFFYRQ